MATNGWQVGKVYYSGGGFGLPNGVGRGFTQPGGDGTTVYPTQITDPSSTIAPFSTAAVTEFTGLCMWGCSHSTDFPMAIPEFDYTANQQVMLIACPRCSYVQYAMAFKDFYNTTINPVVFP